MKLGQEAELISCASALLCLSRRPSIDRRFPRLRGLDTHTCSIASASVAYNHSKRSPISRLCNSTETLPPRSEWGSGRWAATIKKLSLMFSPDERLGVSDSGKCFYLRDSANRWRFTLARQIRSMSRIWRQKLTSRWSASIYTSPSPDCQWTVQLYFNATRHWQSAADWL